MVGRRGPIGGALAALALGTALAGCGGSGATAPEEGGQVEVAGALQSSATSAREVALLASEERTEAGAEPAGQSAAQGGSSAEAAASSSSPAGAPPARRSRRVRLRPARSRESAATRARRSAAESERLALEHEDARLGAALEARRSEEAQAAAGLRARQAEELAAAERAAEAPPPPPPASAVHVLTGEDGSGQPLETIAEKKARRAHERLLARERRKLERKAHRRGDARALL